MYICNTHSVPTGYGCYNDQQPAVVCIKKKQNISIIIGTITKMPHSLLCS